MVLYLLTWSRLTRAAFVYMAGVFLSYLTVGILLRLGQDAALREMSDVLWSSTALAVQALVGASMPTYSVLTDAGPNTRTACGERKEQRSIHRTLTAGRGGCALACGAGCLGGHATHTNLTSRIAALAAGEGQGLGGPSVSQGGYSPSVP